jgi:hypothetical protein
LHNICHDVLDLWFKKIASKCCLVFLFKRKKCQLWGGRLWLHCSPAPEKEGRCLALETDFRGEGGVF